MNLIVIIYLIELFSCQFKKNHNAFLKNKHIRIYTPYSEGLLNHSIYSG